MRLTREQTMQPTELTAETEYRARCYSYNVYKSYRLNLQSYTACKAIYIGKQNIQSHENRLTSQESLQQLVIQVGTRRLCQHKFKHIIGN